MKHLDEFDLNAFEVVGLQLQLDRQGMYLFHLIVHHQGLRVDLYHLPVFDDDTTLLLVRLLLQCQQLHTLSGDDIIQSLNVSLQLLDHEVLLPLRLEADLLID